MADWTGAVKLQSAIHLNIYHLYILNLNISRAKRSNRKYSKSNDGLNVFIRSAFNMMRVHRQQICSVSLLVVTCLRAQVTCFQAHHVHHNNPQQQSSLNLFGPGGGRIPTSAADR